MENICYVVLVDAGHEYHGNEIVELATTDKNFAEDFARTRFNELLVDRKEGGKYGGKNTGPYQISVEIEVWKDNKYQSEPSIVYSAGVL